MEDRRASLFFEYYSVCQLQEVVVRPNDVNKITLSFEISSQCVYIIAEVTKKNNQYGYINLRDWLRHHAGYI